MFANGMAVRIAGRPSLDRGPAETILMEGLVRGCPKFVETTTTTKIHHLISAW
jgi:hypothetical protein